jgi:Mce-associated membrane protein
MAIDVDTARTVVGIADADEPPGDHIDIETVDVPDGEEAALERAAAPRRSPIRLALAAGIVIVLALGGLASWLGYEAHTARQADQRHNLFLQTARQGAVNLTSISYADADADVARILDSATGPFRDDFQRRAQPFIEVVRQAQSASIGTVTEAGMESETKDSAQVLVAVSLKTSTAGLPQRDPRSWRMRIAAQRDGQSAKISNVEFVP